MTIADNARFIRCFFTLVFLSSLALVPSGMAQQTDSLTPPGSAQVDAGSRPSGTYDGVQDNVNLMNGNLSFCIPLVSLPGPQMPPGLPALDLNIPLCFNSSQVLGGASSIPPDEGLYHLDSPLSWSPWINVPQPGSGWTLTGQPGVWAQYGTVDGYPQAFMADGSRRMFLYDTNGPNQIGPSWGPDGSGEDLYYIGFPNGSLFMKNGIRVTPSCVSNYCPNGGGNNMSETVTDTDGHAITFAESVVTGTNGAVTAMNVVTDAVGRQVKVSGTLMSSNLAGGTGSISLQYPDPTVTGQTQTVIVQLENNSVSCSSYSGFISAARYTVPNGVSVALPSAVILPNGLQYTFQYDDCSELRQINYPSGGYTRYDYQGVNLSQYIGNGYIQYPGLELWHKYVCPVPASVVSYTQDQCPVAEQVTTYTPFTGGNNSNNTQMTVVDPVGNTTVYQFSQADVRPLVKTQAVETSRQLYDASGKLWKTITTQYLTVNPSNITTGNCTNANNGLFINEDIPTLPTIQDTTLDNGMVSEIQWAYNCQPTFQGPTSLMEKREYDFGPGSHGALLKKTDFTWLHMDPNLGPYYGWSVNNTNTGMGAHILDRKTSETVYDGSGKMVEQTTYQYDYGSPAPNGGAPGVLTSTSRWRNTGSAWLTTTWGPINGGMGFTYPNGTQEVYSYTDNYAGGESPQRTSNGANLGPYNAYPTTITTIANGKSYVRRKQYYWGGGLVAASCGNNFSRTACKIGLSSVPDYTSYGYDLMGRRTSASSGDGGHTTTCYSDDPGATCSSAALPVTSVSTELIQSGINKVSTSVSMHTGSTGLPTTTSELNSDPSCPRGTVNVDTTYDLDGRKNTVSNPYCSTNPNASTSGTTTYAYDGLSRVTQVTNPDGTYAANTYTGRAVLSADEGNGTDRIQRISQKDALGRLTAVCEVTGQSQQGSSNNAPAACNLDYSGTGFLTTYGYDASNSNGPLEAVTSVTQGGESRSFTYDSLGELTSATNPESGTTKYTTYDLSGNLILKMDARSIATGYTYDGLNRLTSKSYGSDPALTPASCFQYDQTSMANGMGRLTSEWTQAGSCSSTVPTSGAITERTFGYDLMGRVATDVQSTSSSRAFVDDQYDYAGDVSNFDNGLSGAPSSYLNFSNTYSSADRLSTITAPETAGSNSQTFPLLAANGYSPAGAITGAQIGPGITLARTYNTRLLPTGETDFVGTTPGTASASLSGNEQMFVQGVGTITFNGSEQSKTVNGSTVYDQGAFYMQLAGEQPFEIQYGQGSTPQSLAAAFVSGWLTPCSSGRPWTGYASGATVYITSCAPTTSWTLTATLVGCGYYFSSSGCSFSASTGGATATITFSGTEEGTQGGSYVMGVFKTSGGGPVQEASVSWGSSSTPNSLAASLAASFGSCSTSGNVVTATASGATVTVTSCQAGMEYTVSGIGGGCGCQGYQGAAFDYAVSGVVDAGDVYDSGTATLTVNNTQIATTNWGQNSSSQSILQALASAASGNSLVNVAYNSSNGGLNITAYEAGADSTDYSWALTVTDTSGLLVTPSFRGASGTLQGSSDAVLYSWSIPSSGGYGPNGDVLSVTDSVMGTWAYTYDDFNRLTSGTASTGADANLALNWTYDRYGNRWGQTATCTAGVGNCNATALQPQLTFYGNTNRIDNWSYDAAGNLLNDQINTYTYDAENRIAKLNGAPAYIYDAEGNRVEKLNSAGAVTAIYILNASDQQITELNGAGQWQHSNIYTSGGRLLATYDAPGQPSPGYHYNLTDWLGTKRMQTTAGGSQQETCMSNPFGDGQFCTGGADATEQHFTGKDRDVESGLDYFYARYYTSDLARFMTPDWAAKPAAVPYANYGDPQSLNLYEYVGNNPNTGIDMDGHVSITEDNPGGLGPESEDFSIDVAGSPGSGTNANGTPSTKTKGSGATPPTPAPAGDNKKNPQQKPDGAAPQNSAPPAGSTQTPGQTPSGQQQTQNQQTASQNPVPSDACKEDANKAAEIMGDVKPSKGDIITTAAGAIIGAGVAVATAPEDGPVAPVVYKATGAVGGAVFGFLKDTLIRGTIKALIWGNVYSACVNPNFAMSPGLVAP